MNGQIRRIAGFGVLAAVMLVGCQEEKPEPLPRSALPQAAQPEGAFDIPASVEEVPEEPAPPPTIPDVVMTEAMATTNVVGVGDRIPEGQLPNLDGETRPLQELYGSQLTVVLFWNSENLYSLQELQDLQIDVFEPYKERGVQVVGIHVRDTGEVAREKVEQAGATYQQLLDKDGSYFAKVATEHLPRTYLLNAKGEVVWFDLEYSTATRRNLHQAIEVALSEAGGEKTPAAKASSAGAAEAK